MSNRGFFVILDKRPQKYEAFLNSMHKAIDFLKEVREELNKVVWPTKKQTIRYTVLVIIVALVVGVFLGGLDYILTKITAIILEKYGR